MSYIQPHNRAWRRQQAQEYIRLTRAKTGNRYYGRDKGAISRICAGLFPKEATN